MRCRADAWTRGTLSASSLNRVRRVDDSFHHNGRAVAPRARLDGVHEGPHQTEPEAAFGRYLLRPTTDRCPEPRFASGRRRRALPEAGTTTARVSGRALWHSRTPPTGKDRLSGHAGVDPSPLSQARRTSRISIRPFWVDGSTSLRSSSTGAANRIASTAMSSGRSLSPISASSTVSTSSSGSSSLAEADSASWRSPSSSGDPRRSTRPSV